MLKQRIERDDGSHHAVGTNAPDTSLAVASGCIAPRPRPEVGRSRFSGRPGPFSNGSRNANRKSKSKRPTGAALLQALWLHRNVAGLAMEVETKRSIHDLEAIRDNLDTWRVVVPLREASLASLAAGRTPQVFIPLVCHDKGPNPALRRSFQSNRPPGVETGRYPAS